MGNDSTVRLDALSTLDASALPTEFRLFQFGDNPTSKGTFKLDEAGAAEVMAAYRKHGAELAIDYEHQTFEAASNGQPAPAAGWFKPELRSDGLWATNVRWTSRAAEMLRNREYRYFSPTFNVDKNNRITKLLPAALTNLPASHGQQALVAAKDDGEMVTLAVWSTAFVDTLPDSSFLYVSPGGKKDGDGKTVPRSLRHFPVRDSSGKVDLAHLRNALARIPQSNLPADVKARLTAEAKRLLGHQQTKEPFHMGNLGTIVGLKDDASEDAVTERVISLARIEHRLLEATGAANIADAMTVVLANKDAASERDQYKTMCREWEDRHHSEQLEAKSRQIESIIQGAIFDGRVSLRDTDRIDRWRKHGEEYGPEQLKKLVAERDPRPVRQYQAPAPVNTVKAQLDAIAKWKQANPGKSSADAYVALAETSPALFGDTTGVAVEE